MAGYAFSVQRVTISGKCLTGAEEWSTGFFVGSESAGVSNPTQSFADAIRDAWRVFYSAAGTKGSTLYGASEVKVSQLGTDGKTILENTVFSTFSPTATGTLATPIYPPQISLAATLSSAVVRGLGAKGRMYLPGICASVTSNGTIATTDAAAIAANLKTFFDTVNTAAPTGSKIILASAGKKADGTGKVNRLVRTVKVGNVYDTQRRRRNGIQETYSTSNLV